MIKNTLITGFPRIGEKRELKKALEKYWAGKISFDNLEQAAKQLRKKNWLQQSLLGIEYISSNDFSYYDCMLDTIIMLNCIPQRFRQLENKTKQYFAMARGNEAIWALGMTKWFNTNYHYIVPELDDDVDFSLNAQKIIEEYKEAKELGLKTKINIIGPITFLGLSKTKEGQNPYDFFDKVIDVYKNLFDEIAKLDDSIVVQMDEPLFVKGLSENQKNLISKTYNALASVNEKIKIIVTTYFEHSCEATSLLAKTKIWGIGLDFIHGIKNFDSIEHISDKKLVAGVVDGRNIWTNDISKTLQLLGDISIKIPKEQIIVSTSCSLLHCPYSIVNEPENELKKTLAFSVEKVNEVAFVGKVFFGEKLTAQDEKRIKENAQVIEAKFNSRANDDAVKLCNLDKRQREATFSQRITCQLETLKLPVLPTTTIGSFPQTSSLRKARRDYKAGLIDGAEYESIIKKYIDECIRFQEEIGLDVLVHGEPERNDMVEYFGQLLKGFHFTQNGWVQSYGSRCVKPPVIFGNISRLKPMTVDWISYAQSKTEKWVKGMLTGPVTIISWSFVRTDIPLNEVATQLACVLRDEIADLQKAGIRIIQVDEAAFKEGYPLRSENVKEYEKWAVDAFKLAVSSADKETQIHTHMCYSDFNAIIKTIEEMDADVITLETARGGNELLKIFKTVGYKNHIGPGVYDIHSPRTPDVEEFKNQILKRLEVIDRSKMWVNPDCGLKTRKWDEVKIALQNMVESVQKIRNQ